MHFLKLYTFSECRKYIRKKKDQTSGQRKRAEKKQEDLERG